MDGQDLQARDEASTEVVTGEVVDAAAPLTDEELPPDPAQALPLLAEQLVTARADADQLLEHLQRKQAELENFRKRAQRDAVEVRAFASLRLVEAMLPVLDSFDVAFAHDPQTPTEEKLVAGIRSTYTLIFDILRKEGLEAVEADGVPFDPECHEAAAAPPEGEGVLMVSQELRRGYRIGERVIRPALVAVDYA